MHSVYFMTPQEKTLENRFTHSANGQPKKTLGDYISSRENKPFKLGFQGPGRLSEDIVFECKNAL